MLAAEYEAVPDAENVRRALILDDDRDFADSLSEILESAGYTTCVINEMSELASRAKSFNAQVALVDIRLRNASGMEAIERLQNLSPNIQSIVMTGYATVENAIAALHKGAYDYLRKPFHAEELLAVLNRCFDKIDLEEKKRNSDRDLRIALEKAEAASRAKSEFLANMSHELRTPLNAILGYSEVIKEQYFGPMEPGKYLEYAKDIFDSGTFVLELVNDVLDMAAIESGKAELKETEVDINALIDTCIKMVQMRADDYKVELKKDVAQDLNSVSGDSRMLKQMILNLLSNAVKFTPDGGLVTISANRDENGDLCLAVSDNGVGIEPDQLAVIVEPFAVGEDALTRANDGIGLGLPLTKSMTELHGGSMDLSSTPDVGTVVTIKLPSSRIVA